MSPTDRARILFSEARHSRTVGDIARLCGCTDEEAQKAITDLHIQGVIRRTGTNSYIPSTVRLRHFADGTGRKVTDHESDTAAILAMLPERTITIANHIDRSAGHVVKLLRLAGAVSSANGMWHPPGTALMRSVIKESSADPSPSDGGVSAGGADPASWVETSPTKEGFNCERRGQFVTFAQCYDDYTTAASGHRVCVVACKKCPKGERQRMEYARGGW